MSTANVAMSTEIENKLMVIKGEKEWERNKIGFGD